MRTITLVILTCCTITFPAWAVTCGDILGPGGVYTLTEDVICEGDGPAITVRDGAVLDLAGHLVSRPLIGILLEGAGAVLRNGRVESVGPGENGIGVQVQGVGRHEIIGVHDDALWFGFVIISDHNRLTENMSSADTPFSVGGRQNLLRRNTGGSNGAFVVGGEGNWLIENASLDGGGHGFIVRGTRNRLVGNSTTAFGGISIEGDHNLVLRNQASGASAIVVSGEGNRLIQNTAVDSEMTGPGTLVDTHGDCTHNRWIANVAATADPPCILEGPVALSQVQ